MEEEGGGQGWESDWYPLWISWSCASGLKLLSHRGFSLLFVLWFLFVLFLFFIEARNASSKQVQITVLNAFNILHTETCVTRWWAFFYLKKKKKFEMRKKKKKTTRTKKPHKKQKTTTTNKQNNNNNNPTTTDSIMLTTQFHIVQCWACETAMMIHVFLKIDFLV